MRLLAYKNDQILPETIPAFIVHIEDWSLEPKSIVTKT